MPIAIPALELGAAANANPPATSAIKRSFFMFYVTSCKLYQLNLKFDVKLLRLFTSSQRDRISGNPSRKYRVRSFQILPARGARHRGCEVRRVPQRPRWVLRRRSEPHKSAPYQSTARLKRDRGGFRHLRS